MDSLVRIELRRLADDALMEAWWWDEQIQGSLPRTWNMPASSWRIADDPAWPAGYEWRRYDSTGLPPLRFPADGSQRDWQ